MAVNKIKILLTGVEGKWGKSGQRALLGPLAAELNWIAFVFIK